MADHVRVIGYLCKLLETLVGTSLKPEHFRLCKLNKLNVEEEYIIKEAVHKLCCCSVRNATCNAIVEECVANCLLALGGPILYQWSPESSARQLLLCLGYIIANGAIETLINQLILSSPLGHETLLAPDAAVCEQLVEPLVDSEDARQQYANVIVTQIRHNLKAIANFRQEKAQLLYKVHRDTAGFRGLPHLSVGDLQLISAPDRLSRFLAGCQPFLQAIKAYMRWQTNSHLFWKWMESVLKEEESIDLKKPLSVCQLTFLSSFLRKLEKLVRDSVFADTSIEHDSVKHFSCMRASLTASVQPLQHIIESLNSKIETISISNEKKKHELRLKLINSERISSGEIDNLLKIIDSLVLDKENSVHLKPSLLTQVT